MAESEFAANRLAPNIAAVAWIDKREFFRNGLGNLILMNNHLPPLTALGAVRFPPLPLSVPSRNFVRLTEKT